MTAYFDQAGQKLQKIQQELATTPIEQVVKRLEDIDAELVWDISICSQFEGFPDDLRDRAHQTVLKYSAACQPVNGRDPGYESMYDHIRGLGDLISDMHTIFHNLVTRNIHGFSDDPRAPLRMLYARAEGQREEIVEAGKESQYDPDRDCPMCGSLGKDGQYACGGPPCGGAKADK